jgi:hypothetical protein
LAQVVLPHPQLIFPFQNLVFWNLFEFSATRNQFKINISPHSESKSYQINSIKNPARWDIFPNNTQRHIPIPLKFSATILISFNFQWRNHSIFKNFLHCKSKCHGTKPMHPSFVQSFQKAPKTRSKHLGSVDLITTKQTTCLHR